MSNQAFDSLRELADKVEALQTRLTALEQHIAHYGPRVVKNDLETPGGATWEEPYEPPKVVHPGTGGPTRWIPR